MADVAAPTAPAAAATAPAAAAFDPAGKTFIQRRDAFIEDAKTTYKVTIGIDAGRTAEWQHKHHVAHMFLYNKYTSVKPKNVETGGKTIAWDYFKQAKLWDPVIWSEFLRTKTNEIPQKKGTVAGEEQWQEGKEPDLEKTKENVKQILIDGKIGNSGQAMVSAGYAPCKGPCWCTAGRSKHLSDNAADLSGMDKLDTALKAAKAGTIDDYLKKFGLHRPLVNHPESPEEWHVEAVGDTTKEG